MEWVDGKTDFKRIVTLKTMSYPLVQRLRKTFESVIETDFPEENIDCVGIPYHKSLHELETADRYISFFLVHVGIVV
jgi:hypothetical protein